MKIVSTNFTIADYCEQLQRREITVNRDYQRSDKVWPPIARSYLIETILLGFPLPKLSLHQVTDVKSRKTSKEIVDGQQRSAAINAFFKDKLRLSRSLDTETIASRTYSELDEQDQQRFLDYSLSMDLFVGTTREEVREVFRRMNSYTIPLNAEERRHATYQGPFKWFINRITKRFDEGLIGANARNGENRTLSHPQRPASALNKRACGVSMPSLPTPFAVEFFLCRRVDLRG